MKHSLEDHHREHLRNLGVKHDKKHIFIPPAEYEQHAAAWRRTLPNATEAEIHMKVIGHHASKVQALKHHHKPTRPERLAWAIITLLLILIGITLFAPKAHGQYSKINSIQFQQDGANISGAFFTYPFTINCTVNVTCSIVGGKLVMNSSGSSGTVTSFSAGDLAPLFTTSVGTATSTPALTFSASSVANGNRVLASPDGLSGAYSFRALVANDIPALPYLSSSTVLPLTKTVASGQPLLSYDSTTGAFTQGALTAAQVGALPSTTVLPVTKAAVAGQPLLSYDSTTGAFTQAALTAAQVGALPSSTVLPATKTAASGQPLLSYDATTGAFTQGSLTATNVGLGSVTNDAQTKAAIVPNTAPSAGQILAGNAGGTAYAPVSMSQDCTITSAGVITCTKTNNVSFAASATTNTTSATNITSGTLPAAQMPALTGECTTSAGAVSVTCGSAIAHIVVAGTSTFTTTAVASGACQTTVTTPATGAVASTDTMSWNYTTAPTAATDGRLTIQPWITTDNVNFMRCNNTAASVTPTALVARWKVLR